MTPPSVPGVTDGRVTDLLALAAHLQGELDVDRREHVTDDMMFDATMMNVIGQTGGLAGAHARWQGTAEPAGSREEVAAELAGVVLATAVYAVVGNIHRSVITAAFTADITGLLITVNSIDEAVLELAVTVGRLTQVHLSGEVIALATGAYARVIHLARVYATRTGIDLHAAVTARAQAMLDGAGGLVMPPECKPGHRKRWPFRAGPLSIRRPGPQPGHV
jgi:hypothetical protein